MTASAAPFRATATLARFDVRRDRVRIVVWIVAITLALFQVGALDEVTAGRLENLAAPLASANDQLALITWFQQVAPPAGFGLGAVPWCGYGGSPGCPGAGTRGITPRSS